MPAPKKKSRIKRSQLWIDPEQQFRLIRDLFVILLIGGGLAIANYHVYSSLAALFTDKAVGSEFNSVILWIYGGVTLLVSLGMLLIIGIFYSHRIAGPSFKLSQHLEQLAEGDLRRRVHLRDSDHLAGVGDSINYVAARWSHSLLELENQLRAIKTHERVRSDDALAAQCERMAELLRTFQLPASAMDPNARTTGIVS